METLVLVIHIIVALGMTGLILVQQGKGADAGATFGGGGAATVFGAAGSANFLTRSTAVLTTIFFLTSLGLAVIAKKQAADLMSLPEAAQAPVTQPVTPRPLTQAITPLSATPAAEVAATGTPPAASASETAPATVPPAPTAAAVETAEPAPTPVPAN